MIIMTNIVIYVDFTFLWPYILIMLLKLRLGLVRHSIAVILLALAAWPVWSIGPEDRAVYLAWDYPKLEGQSALASYLEDRMDEIKDSLSTFVHWDSRVYGADREVHAFEEIGFSKRDLFGDI